LNPQSARLKLRFRLPRTPSREPPRRS